MMNRNKIIEKTNIGYVYRITNDETMYHGYWIKKRDDVLTMCVMERER